MSVPRELPINTLVYTCEGLRIFNYDNTFIRGIMVSEIKTTGTRLTCRVMTQRIMGSLGVFFFGVDACGVYLFMPRLKNIRIKFAVDKHVLEVVWVMGFDKG